MAVNSTQGVVLAIFGASAGGHLTALDANATTNGLASLAEDLSAAAGLILGTDLSSDATFTSTVLDNLGVATGTDGYTLAEAYFTSQLAAGASRGSVTATAVEYLLGSSVDSSLTSVAEAFTTNVASAVEYSQGEGASVFAVAELIAQQAGEEYVAPITGETFSFTAATDDDIAGTGGDDVIEARSTHIAATDAADGGAGNDTLNVRVTGNVAAAEVDNVETVNFDIQSFTAPTLDLENVDDVAEINISRTLTGMSTEVTLDNTGDKVINAGAGIETLNVGDYDESLINTGSLTTLALNDTAAEILINVQGTAEIDLGGSATVTDGVISAEGASGSVDITGANMDFSGDLVLEGAVKVSGEVGLFDAGTVTGAEATLQFDAAAADTISLEDIEVAVVSVDHATAMTFSNAEGDLISLDKTAANVTVDAGTDGGDLSIRVTKDESTIDLTGTNSDNVSIEYTSATDDLTLLDIGSTVAVSFASAEYTLDSVTENATTATLTATGDSDLTITSAAVTFFDGSALTGDVSYKQAHTTASEVLLGSGADTYESLAAATATDQTISTGAGNDTIKLSNVTTGNIFAVAGSGDDVFTMKDVAATASMTLLGGDGSDKLTVDAGTDGTAVDLSTATLTNGLAIDSIETIEIKGTDGVTFSAASLSGVTATVIGASGAGQDVTVNSASTDTSVDLSGLTIATTIEGFTIDFSDTKADKAFTATTTAGADIVTYVTAASSAEIDLGAGDDTILLSGDGTDGIGGTITLGAGADVVDFDNATTAVNGSQSVTGELVTIADFDADEDTMEYVLAVAADIIAGSAVDVSGADAAASATDIGAYITDGMIQLIGADSGDIDTLAEWIDVVEAIDADGAGSAVYGFEFDGATYLVETDGAGAETNAIKLAGVVDHSLADTNGGGSVIAIV